MLGGDLFFENADENKENEILLYYQCENSTFPNELKKLKETDDESKADLFLFSDGYNYINSNSSLFPYDAMSWDIILTDSLFYRMLKRSEKSKTSISRADESIKEVESFNYFIYLYGIIRDVYHRTMEGEEFLAEVFRILEFKNIFDVVVISKSESSNFQLTEQLCLIRDELLVLCNLKDECNDNLLTWDLVNLAISEVCKEVKVSTTDEASVLNYSNLSYIVSKIEYPIAIVNDDGAVVLFNDLFSALNILPSNLLDYQDDDWIDINDQFYKVKKNKIEAVGSIFVLIMSKKKDGIKLDHQSELGIITGSIAHELNNPVAGILAAVTILEFEEWDDENLKLLKDLKDSAIRCKELVDTFLGFSRYKVSGLSTKPLGLILDQSLSLLRFRVIESGLNINVDIQKEIKKIECKSVVLPMVIYLLFGELLTLLSHKKLIDENIGKTLCLSVELNDNCLIVLVKSFQLSSADRKSLSQKLIIHLLEMDNMGLKIRDDGFEISSIFEN